MAAATDSGQKLDPRLTANRRLFAQQVSRGTGLNETVVRSWVLAEGGPDGNPLNIGPGQAFASPVAAAAAVVRLLHTNASYKPILDSATRTPQQQIDAIAASPWNGGYKASPAAHKSYGDLIRGVYEHLKPSTSGGGGIDVGGAAGAVGGAVAGAAGAVAGVPGDIWGAVDSIPKAIQAAVTSGESWAASAALTGLAYLLLTIAALLLFGLGISKTTGLKLPSPATAAAAGEIPF